MDENQSRKILIEMLCAAVNQADEHSALVQNIAGEHLGSVYRLAKKHDLAYVVADFVSRNKIEIENAELSARLQKEELIAIYRHEQMKFAFDQICAILDEAHISYVPLKGAVIKAYYPCEYIRTSCDIDILIHEEDLDHAVNCLKEHGYSCADNHYHDISLYSPNKIHLELHFNLHEDMDALDDVLKDAWEYTSCTQGSRCDFSKEFFVFHMYAHMAYHFLAGGCGIRSLLDIWIMEHKMDAHYSCAEALLKKAGIYTFASEMCKIANACFSDHEIDGFSDLVLKYIFSGGVFGTKENYVAVRKTKTKNPLLYAWKRLFAPYKFMAAVYPALKKRPFLLPFYWLARCVSIVFKGKVKTIASELSWVNHVSDNAISEVAEIRSRMGL